MRKSLQGMEHIVIEDMHYQGIPDKYRKYEAYLLDSGYRVMCIPKIFKDEAMKNEPYDYEVGVGVLTFLDKIDTLEEIDGHLYIEVEYNDNVGLIEKFDDVFEKDVKPKGVHNQISFKVGECYSFLKGKEGVDFSFGNGKAILSVVFNEPTKYEIKEFSKGIEYNLTIIDGVIWLIWKVGDLSYMDSPFVANLQNNKNFVLGDGLEVVVLLADNRNGEVKVKRNIMLDPKFTSVLSRHIATQNELIFKDALLKIFKAQSMYTPNEMANMAVVRGTIK